MKVVRTYVRDGHVCASYDAVFGPVRKIELVRVKDILNDVSARSGFTVEEIVGLRRTRDVVRPRFEVMYLARCEHERRKRLDYPALSIPHIGTLLNRDHSTIYYGSEVHADRNGLPKPWEARGCQ